MQHCIIARPLGRMRSLVSTPKVLAIMHVLSDTRKRRRAIGTPRYGRSSTTRWISTLAVTKSLPSIARTSSLTVRRNTREIRDLPRRTSSPGTSTHKPRGWQIHLPCERRTADRVPNTHNAHTHHRRITSLRQLLLDHKHPNRTLPIKRARQPSRVVSITSLLKHIGRQLSLPTIPLPRRITCARRPSTQLW
jgi:hypothetical protein